MLELYWKHAPKTCKNFAELGRQGYYKGTKSHRIIKDFMIREVTQQEQVKVVHLSMASNLKMNFIQT